MSVEQNVQTFLLDHAGRAFWDDCLLIEVKHGSR
jgi:hypothetical protein